MTIEQDESAKDGYFILMIYAALFGALSSLLTVGYMTLYTHVMNLFEQVSLMVFNINVWPLVLLVLGY